MRKIMVSGALAFVLMFLFASNKSFAGGCSANCKFSTCTIGGCTGQYACGCYFGIATCKCEANSTGTATTKKVLAESISNFAVYAMNSGSQGLIDVANTLGTLNEENYDLVVAAFKTQVEHLSEGDRELFSVYLEL